MKNLKQACEKMAHDWAKWHNHSNLVLDDDLIHSINNILDVMGLQIIEKDGEHSIKKKEPA